MSDPSSGTPTSVGPTDDRLHSWKEIAAYLKRDVTTVQRWEKREGMPVHRHLHDRMGSVYAYGSEIDNWIQSRKLRLKEEEQNTEIDQTVRPSLEVRVDSTPPTAAWARRRLIGGAI